MEQQPIVLELDDDLYAKVCEWAAEAGRTPGDWVGDFIEEEMRKRRAAHPERYRT
jgi:hypothetical protein